MEEYLYSDTDLAATIFNSLGHYHFGHISNFNNFYHWCSGYIFQIVQILAIFLQLGCHIILMVLILMPPQDF